MRLPFVGSIVLTLCCSSGIAVAQEKPAGSAPTDTANPAAPNPPLPAAPPAPPANPGPGTMVPQGNPSAQPYPYPYYPQPYYPYPYAGRPGAYPPAWAPPTPKKTQWYGWQTLLGVVGGDIISVIGGSSGTEPLIYVGIGAHVLTGPIVHWAHGHVGKGFASLGLNVGLPGLGILSGIAIGGLGGGYLGLFIGGIGYVLAPTLDMSLLSTETVEDATTVRKGARALLPTSVGIMPMLDQNRRGLMLVGQF